jgi:hypothetical protein
MLVVLDPGQLLAGNVRGHLAAAERKADAFRQRQVKLEQVWNEVCMRPHTVELRTFARLCSRNGRAKAASATRMVLKYIEANAPLSADSSRESDPAERLFAELASLARQRRSGTLSVTSGDGTTSGEIVVVDGQVVDASCGAKWGRNAFRALLREGPDRLTFSTDGVAGRPRRIPESTPALMIASLESLGEGRRRTCPNDAAA